MKVDGFVLLSGDRDSYGDGEETLAVVNKRAPDFLIKKYEGALHEIDNEAEPLRTEAHQDIVNFLLTHNQRDSRQTRESWF